MYPPDGYRTISWRLVATDLEVVVVEIVGTVVRYALRQIKYLRFGDHLPVQLEARRHGSGSRGRA